jgi:hypothetical protein
LLAPTKSGRRVLWEYTPESAKLEAWPPVSLWRTKRTWFQGPIVIRIKEARTSVTQQELDGQIELLRKEGVDLIFSEQVSGKDVDGRKEFQRLLSKVTDGDVIICTKLDGFARSTRDLLNIVHDLKQRGVGLKCLQDALRSLARKSSLQRHEHCKSN